MSFTNFKFDVDVDGIAVVTSGKDSFSAGADLSFLESLNQVFSEIAKRDGEEAATARLFEQVRNLSLLFRRLETCGKPWAAAINGTALGGGFELCLACRSRAAAARSALLACWRPPTRCSFCSREIRSGSTAPNR